jgi:cytochrome c peroxidase
VTHKLPALRDYQFSLDTPPPPADSFDATAAARGKAVFAGAGKCATCHIPPTYTDINKGILHDAAETGMDPAYAKRSATGMYRTTPLRALWQHRPYFHDGSAATLADVVNHYDTFLELGLTAQQKVDLVEFPEVALTVDLAGLSPGLARQMQAKEGSGEFPPRKRRTCKCDSVTPSPQLSGCWQPS